MLPSRPPRALAVAAAVCRRWTLGVACVLVSTSAALLGCGTDEPQTATAGSAPRGPGPSEAARPLGASDESAEADHSPGMLSGSEAGESAGLDDLAEVDRQAFRELTGKIVIDGSSTVFPITEAVASLYRRLAPSTSVQLGVSGTGGGFAKFCRGSTDFSNASRPIKQSEQRACDEHGVQFVELPVAFDGVSVVLHRDNHFCRCLTLEELRRLWSPEAEGSPTRWSDLRAEWPPRPIRLFAPGRDSGTFDYFTRAVVGAEGSSRHDFVGSEDDYLLAQDIAREPDSLGFFGYAYYREHRKHLSLLSIDAGAGCVSPDEGTIFAGSYRPLSRPIFLYVRAEALGRPEVRQFARLYLEQAASLVPAVGYVALPERAYHLGRQRLDLRRTGSVFEGGSEVGVSIERLLEIEAVDTEERDPEERDTEERGTEEGDTEEGDTEEATAGRNAIDSEGIESEATEPAGGRAS